MSIKKTKRVLGAKKEVTKKDAKKVKPLLKYWSKRLKKARYSDNWFVLGFGVFLGFVLGVISHLGRV